ncbi:hypothetical protein LR68_00255 [Anoxybacillus sp. BCO1]|nr:hypothetical protein LR68_00255 [Anoxybacillus sp. BCO1]
MGLVGLYRVFEYGRKHEIISEEQKHSVTVKPWGIELDTDVLPQLPRAYFLYLLEEYSVARRECERLDAYIEQVTNEKQFKSNINTLKKSISDTGTKILKYFTHETLENTLKQIKEIKEI